MELKYTYPNSEIVLASTLNLVEFFLRIVKTVSINKSIMLFFSRICYDCPQNKMFYNFHITNPNEIIQIPLYKQKYIIKETN